MLGKRSRLVIGKLTDPLISGDRTGVPDVITSPKSPLDFKIRSPKGLKNCDLGAVGLGIVAALEKSGGRGGEIPAKFIVGISNLNRSDPIPVKTSAKNRDSERTEMGCRESYNYVNSHKPNKSTFPEVFCCDGVEDGSGGHDRRGFEKRQEKKLGVFCESPPAFVKAIPAYPTSDFLSSCHLCRKKLHGRDIYMYRGEKAFCSSECRYRQIVIDERKEKCRSEASRSVDISGSPYTGGQLFSAGIIVA